MFHKHNTRPIASKLNAFLSLFRRHNTRPVVKKVSALVDKRSHKQRKYLSLMLVPSYSSGRTRSLRIPQVLFYCILGVVCVVSAVTAGLYIRSERFARQYQDTREYLYDTQHRLEDFQNQSLEEQARLLDESLQLYEQLTEEQRMFRIEQHLLRQRQQNALNELQGQIDELEQMIRAFDEHMQAQIDGISTRLFIPPVLAIYNMMTESRAYLLSQSVLFNPANGYGQATVGFLQFPGYENGSVIDDMPPPPPCEDTLFARIEMLMAELELQELLLEDLLFHQRRMDPHLRNFPTLWPITAQISSPFGWRRNPFGGRGSEFHSGIDLRAPTGTPIRAAGGGTVTFQGWRSGYGNTVIIDHGSGFTTLYAHNSANLVNVGQRVERGDIIARVGSTGRTTGPHLHFEVMLNGSHLNPRHYMIEHWN